MQHKTRQQLDSEIERDIEEFAPIMRELLKPRDLELERAALALDEKIILPRVLH
jgi:hypothetical protein